MQIQSSIETEVVLKMKNTTTKNYVKKIVWVAQQGCGWLADSSCVGLPLFSPSPLLSVNTRH